MSVYQLPDTHTYIQITRYLHVHITVINQKISVNYHITAKCQNTCTQMTSFNVSTTNSPDLDINISRYLSSTPYATLTDIYIPNVGVENHCTRVKILTLIFSMQTPMYRGLSTSITLRQAL